MMMYRLSLLKSLARAASCLPLRTAMFAEWECPAMSPPRPGGGSKPPGVCSIYGREGGVGKPRAVRPWAFDVLFHGLQLLLDLGLTRVRLAAAARLVELDRLFPGLLGLAGLVELGQHVAQVVPDRRVVGPVRQGGRLLQPFAGLGRLAPTEQHPAQTVQVGGVVAVL